ncbi:hypothetical protein AAY473_033798 [Plecturocebus cupreus]
MDNNGTLKIEGEETAQSHDASNHTMVWIGPNLVPEMKEMTLQDPQIWTMRLPQMIHAPDRMLKKPTQETEQILLQTQTPFTPVLEGGKSEIKSPASTKAFLLHPHAAERGRAGPYIRAPNPMREKPS